MVMGMASPKLAALAIAVCAVGGAAGIGAGCGDDGVAPAPVGDGGAGDGADAEPDGEARMVPKGTRVLGISMAIGDLAFGNHVQLARDAGVRATNVPLGWDEIELPLDAGAGMADAADDAAPPTQLFHPALHIADLVLAESKTQALVAVSAIDVGGSRAPADLAGRPLDDTEVAARYDRLTDYVLRSTPDLEIAALFVGTEVDVPLGESAAQHAAFATFVGRAAAHAHAVRPGLKVGFTVTSDGVEGIGPRLAAAWAASDIVGVSFLPVDAAGRARSPAEARADLERVLARIPLGKPVFLRAAGMPTSPLCGGDEDAQAAFVTAVFDTWDRHADRMPIVVFHELSDAPAETVAAIAARYRRTDASFLAFLGSLGMRTANGRAKRGWDTLLRDARARGF